MQKEFTQEQGKNLDQNSALYSKYLDWLNQTSGADKAAFMHYLNRYYCLSWDEFWQQHQEDRWRMAYRIYDRITDFGNNQLPEEVEQDLENCPPELTKKYWNNLWT